MSEMWKRYSRAERTHKNTESHVIRNYLNGIRYHYSRLLRMSSQLQMPTEKVVWSIQNLVDLHKKDKLVINKEYQRSEVWKPPKKQLLLDSILNDYDIGSIILRQKEDKWEILDGQQRLKAIFDFVDGNLALGIETANHGGKMWDELEPSVQWGQFMNRLVYTTKIYSIDDETTSRIFLRVQEGMPLIGAEKLNAMRGAFRNKVFEVSQHPFFRQTGVSEFRFAYRYLIAQFAAQELSDGVSKHLFKDAKFRGLKEIYEIYKNSLPPKVFERVSSALDFLQKVFGTSAQVITKKSDFLSVCLLASYVLQKFAIKGKEASLKDFIVDFLHKIELAGYTDMEGYYAYWVARSSSPDSKTQLENRFQIILRKFLEYEPTLELKDPQREFDWGQRLSIYAKAYREARQQNKQEAECKICGKPTPLDKGAADHIKPYNLGGKTIVENGQWTCIPCNSAKSDKFTSQ
jgi:5-methylcytosine-specific restriction endonuclease McrA